MGGVEKAHEVKETLKFRGGTRVGLKKEVKKQWANVTTQGRRETSFSDEQVNEVRSAMRQPAQKGGQPGAAGKGAKSYWGTTASRSHPGTPAPTSTECWECGKEGHFARDCPGKQKGQGKGANSREKIGAGKGASSKGKLGAPKPRPKGEKGGKKGASQGGGPGGKKGRGKRGKGKGKGKDRGKSKGGIKPLKDK